MAEVFICIYPSGYSLDAGELARYGATHRYTSMASMEAGEDIDWTTAGDKPTVEIIGGDGTNNWSTAGEDTTSVDFYGWDLDATNYLTITTIGTARSSDGKWDSSAYILSKNDGASLQVYLGNNLFFMHIDGVQIKGTGSANYNLIRLFGTSPGSCTIEMQNCYIDQQNTGGAARAVLVDDSGSNLTFRMWNTVIENDSSTTLNINSISSFYLAHNTFYGDNGDIGTDLNSLSGTVKNIVTFNHSNDFLDGGSATIDYVASDDTDGINSIDMNENAGGEWTDAFIDYTTSDFNIKNVSSILYDAGTSLTGGSAPFTDLTGDSDPMANDIVGNSRSTDDVGAYVLVGGTVYNMTISESSSISDLNSSAAIFNSAISESAAISDLFTSAVIFLNTLSESLNITDDITSQKIINGIISESINIADSITSIANMSLNITETDLIDDVFLSTGIFAHNISESAIITDTIRLLVEILENDLIIKCFKKQNIISEQTKHEDLLTKLKKRLDIINKVKRGGGRWH
jgi:hypothetical protein